MGIEIDKNYPANPSLRVNMRSDILPAKNNGFYIDKISGKNLVCFRPEFIYHYLSNYKNLQYDHNLAIAAPEENAKNVASNILLYGVPGCGKSHTIKTKYCDDESVMERIVFHPDYTNSDFIGQILPQNNSKRKR